MAKIKVTSPSFSTHPVLRQKLLEHFPDAILNLDEKRFNAQELVEYLCDADGCIIGLEKFDRAAMDALPNLRILSKYGVGLDNVDVDYARTKNLNIGWRPGINKRSVSEMTLCFMIGLCRNIFFSSFLLKQGQWKKDGGRMLTGRKVGIVGCGFIGEDLLRLLQPYGCNILVCDILDKREVVSQYGARQVELDELLRQSEIITMHVPLTSATQHMISTEAFARMRDDAFLVNTSRGGVVDQQALKMALQSQRIAGAALDVFAEEPPSDLEFLSLPNLMVTPHTGGNAREAVEAMGLAAIQNLVEFFGGR